MVCRQPVLVTGSHRSGTTWIGKMLAASPQVGYIQEPFNMTFPQRPGVFTAKVAYWFTYITKENEAAYYKALRDTLSFRYNLPAELAALQSRKDVARMLRDYTQFAWYRSRGVTPLMKDPLALFSSVWLADTFDMRVIVMIRHPAAFASSLKKLNWKHDFSHFLRQPLLMRDYLYPFEAEITAFMRKEHDILDEAALLWRIIHYTILKYKNAHPDWIFLRHEDISKDPITHFAYLYKRCALDFSEHVKTVIEDYTTATNPGESRKGVLFDKRDSRATSHSWKKRFTEAEITQLRKQTEDVAHVFYADNEW